MMACGVKYKSNFVEEDESEMQYLHVTSLFVSTKEGIWESYRVLDSKLGMPSAHQRQSKCLDERIVGCVSR
jgi:hypothetical protein